jgi:hypothetical protein
LEKEQMDKHFLEVVFKTKQSTLRELYPSKDAVDKALDDIFKKQQEGAKLARTVGGAIIDLSDLQSASYLVEYGPAFAYSSPRRR